MDIEARLTNVPHDPGVYIFKDEAGRPLYVGKALDLRKRLQQHFRGDSLGAWAETMRSKVRDLETIVTRTETEALILEANLIKQHKPPYNIRLADDKSYPYLRLTNEPYPRLVLLRDLPPNAAVRLPGGRGAVRRGFHDPKRHEVQGFGGGQIFGPFPNAKAMHRMREIASQVFGLRQCRRELTGAASGRACLNYHIKRCVAPCQGNIAPEEYAAITAQVVAFLEGRLEEVERDFRRRMEEASAAQDFERAAIWRDKIRAIERATEEQLITGGEERDQDVLGVAVEDDWAVVDIFPVRAGLLLNPSHLSFSHARGRLEQEVLSAALTLHYSAQALPPRTLLLPLPLDEAPEWEQMLGDLRGHKVALAVPQRGEKRRLVLLAQRNAQVNLARLQEERSRKRHENQAAVSDLGEALDLPKPPRRLECYDISNLQGQQATGSMVVFTDGLADKKNYRRFQIHLNTGQPDDYAMLAEMLTRRLQRGLAGDEKFLPLPDLIVMDGGKGQVSTAQRVLEGQGVGEIALAGLAKQEEEVFVPRRSEPLNMEAHPRGWFLLQRLRDEAHRFAQSYHHHLRSRAITQSQLEQVPGIGPTRRKALFAAFPSIQAMSEASLDELAAVPGLTRDLARDLLHLLQDHGDSIETGEDDSK
jgi:excinuclease ABC subunit C